MEMFDAVKETEIAIINKAIADETTLKNYFLDKIDIVNQKILALQARKIMLENKCKS